MTQRRRIAAFSVTVLASLLVAGCGSGEGPYTPNDEAYKATPEESVRAVIRDATLLLSTGNVDGFLSKQCPAAVSEVKANPSIREYLKDTYAGVSVASIENIEIADTKSTAQVTYTKPGTSDFPQDATEVKLERVDGLWKMC